MNNSLVKLLGNMREQQVKKKRAIRCLLGLTKPKEDEPPPVKAKPKANPKPKKARVRRKAERVPRRPAWNLEVIQAWNPKSVEYKSPFESGYAFIHFLKKRGYKYLGSGAFSTVLGKENSDRVIKVTRSNDNWIDYIQWAAKKGYCGGFAPRVYSYKEIKTKREGSFFVSVVEKMEKTSSHLKVQEDNVLVSTLLGYHSRGNILAGCFLEELIPGIVSFETELRKEFSKPNEDGERCRLDYHGGNFMVRKDGSFVFTDPVCGDRKTTANRLKAKDFTTAGFVPPTSLANAIRGLIESSYRH